MLNKNEKAAQAVQYIVKNFVELIVKNSNNSSSLLEP